MEFSDDLRKILSGNIDRLVRAGAEYVDARYFADDSSEYLVLYDGDLEANDTGFQSGLGVRVLFGGAWGFAASSDMSNAVECFDMALQNARTAAKLVKVPLSMGRIDRIVGKYSSPVEVDPFEMPLEDKLDFLIGIDKTLAEDWILRRMVFANLQRKRILFMNSDGSDIEKEFLNVFGSMAVMAMDSDGEMQRRSMSLFSTGDGTRGWEMILQPELYSGHSDRIKSELSGLLSADTLEYGKRSVILLPGQGHLQVHETIGHPLELDRILGYELSYAGGSFVGLDDFGKLQYGTDKLNVSAYGEIANSPGTFGYDDDGMPERD